MKSVLLCLLLVITHASAANVRSNDEKKEEEYVIEEISDGVHQQQVPSEEEDDTAAAGLASLRIGANESEALGRVFYNGSQLWKVRLESGKQLRILSELKKAKGSRKLLTKQINTDRF